MDHFKRASIVPPWSRSAFRSRQTNKTTLDQLVCLPLWLPLPPCPTVGDRKHRTVRWQWACGLSDAILHRSPWLAVHRPPCILRHSHPIDQPFTYTLALSLPGLMLTFQDLHPRYCTTSIAPRSSLLLVCLFPNLAVCSARGSLLLIRIDPLIESYRSGSHRPGGSHQSRRTEESIAVVAPC